MERWERMYFDGQAAGFLYRRLRGGELTTRTAFQGVGPTDGPGSTAARFLSESVITLSEEGTIHGWRSCEFQDSSTTQRVSVDRERAGLAPDAVPSYGEWLLLRSLLDQDQVQLGFDRLEESALLTGALTLSPASMVRRGTEPVERPDGQVVVAERIETLASGVHLSTHWAAGDEVVLSDWGGAAVSHPVADETAAVEGLDQDLVLFARGGLRR